MDKIRLDRLVMEKTGASRNYAQEIIENGYVSVNGAMCTQPGAKFSDMCVVGIAAVKMKYVSRGGYKLEAALRECYINITGLVCGDIGASTGGFTDCMLQNGAARVYAVDIGTGQLAEALRNDSRVISLEKTDIRGLILPEKLDIATVDVSFISITKIVDDVIKLLKDNGRIVWLIKPQFEAESEKEAKRIINDEKVRNRVVENVLKFLSSNGMDIIGIMQSPITGGDGNIEYLVGTYGKVQ